MVRELTNKIIPHPSTPKLPPGSGFMHLTICFSPDGETTFYPDAENPQDLALAFAKVIKLFRKKPELIKYATGVCSGECGHTGRQL